MKRTILYIMLALLLAGMMISCQKKEEPTPAPETSKPAPSPLETRDQTGGMSYDQIMEAAREFSYSEKYDDAVDLFKRAIEKEPDRIDAYEELSYTYLSQEKYDEALKVLDTAIEKEPENSSLLQKKAQVLKAAGKYEDCAEIYAKLLENGENNSYVISGLAGCYEDMKKYDEAEKYHNMNAEKHPDEVRVYSEFGSYWSRRASADENNDKKIGDYQKAEDWYMKAYEKADPKSDFEDKPSYLYMAGEAYSSRYGVSGKQEDKQKAIENYKKFIETAPEHVWVEPAKEALEFLKSK